jgi:effector-binding domain-containing protein/ribosome-associated toxin RatA of RatAB toxin-antitoxin module
MKFLKRLLLSILLLIVLLALVSFFLPSKSHVERSAQINAKPEAVYALVNDLTTYDQWMPWNQKDPNMKKKYDNESLTSGKGASYSWESKVKDVGVGTLKITESIPNKKVITALSFQDMGVSMGGWEMEEKNGGTEVKWYMESEVGGNIFYKMVGKYIFLFMDKMVGPDFEKGLASMKKLAESGAYPKTTSNLQSPTVIIEEKDMPAQTVLYVSETAADMKEIGEKLGKIYGEELGAFLKKNGLEMAGPPVAWYTSNKPPFVFDAGVPVNKATAPIGGRIKLRPVPAGKVVVAHYRGPYELMTKGYDEIQAWLKANNKTATGRPYEVYIGDPVVEKDPYKVLTDIVMPYQ